MYYSHGDKGFVVIKIPIYMGKIQCMVLRPRKCIGTLRIPVKMSSHWKTWSFSLWEIQEFLFQAIVSHESSAMYTGITDCREGSYELHRITQVWKWFKNLRRRNPQTLLKPNDTTFGSLSPLLKLGGLYWEILIAYLPSFNPLASSAGIGYYQTGYQASGLFVD